MFHCQQEHFAHFAHFGKDGHSRGQPGGRGTAHQIQNSLPNGHIPLPSNSHLCRDSEPVTALTVSDSRVLSPKWTSLTPPEAQGQGQRET